MPNTLGDSLIPIGVVAICAASLAAVAQLGPDRIPRFNQTSAASLATAGTSRTAADQPGVARKVPRVDWRPQPAADQPLTRIGFGSCFRQWQPAPIWQNIVQAAPQTFLMLGDNVYGDFKTADGEKLAKAYSQLAAHNDFKTAVAAVPMLATWDDHDYGANDGGADFEHKATAARIFGEFWSGSGSLDGNRGPGIAYAQTFGPVGRRTQIIMLDARSFRSPLKRTPNRERGKGPYLPDDDAAKTMLGDAQWQWLEARLNEPADLRLIGSGIQVIAEGHTWERWGNLPRERERLLAMLDAAGGQKIILSGDRHRAAIYRRDRAGKGAIHEVTSSSLNAGYPDPTESGPHQLGEMYGASNFGIIEIDWNARLITLTLRGEDGAAARAQIVWLGGLG